MDDEIPVQAIAWYGFMAPFSSHFLIASPQLADPRFRRTVILMLHHHEEGAMGLIINRETTTPLGEVSDELTDLPGADQIPVSVGGPVSGPLVSLHGHPDYSESEIVPGVHLATSKEFLTALVTQNKKPMRIFSGYAGWGPGQLESEMNGGGWISVPASAEHVFHDNLPNSWQDLSETVGRQFWKDTLGINNFPTDIWLN